MVSSAELSPQGIGPEGKKLSRHYLQFFKIRWEGSSARWALCRKASLSLFSLAKLLWQTLVFVIWSTFNMHYSEQM